jgi:hypothetical protein
MRKKKFTEEKRKLAKEILGALLSIDYDIELINERYRYESPEELSGFIVDIIQAGTYKEIESEMIIYDLELVFFSRKRISLDHYLDFINRKDIFDIYPDNPSEDIKNILEKLNIKLAKDLKLYLMLQ